MYESKQGIIKIASLMKVTENLVPLMSLLFQAIANIIFSIKVFPNMGTTSHTKVFYSKPIVTISYPVSILYKFTAGRYRPVSYPDGPITARCRFIKNASWDTSMC